jgi:hypothetical protein
LANMRGAGAPIFEDDFPPGTDQMGEILQGPMAKQRMEFELASRLHSVDIGEQENRRLSLLKSPSSSEKSQRDSPMSKRSYSLSGD